MSGNLNEDRPRLISDSKDHGIIGPSTRPLGAIIAGLTMLVESEDRYKRHTEDNKNDDVQFTNGEIKALSDFIDIDMGIVKRVTNTYAVYGKYLALELNQKRKHLAQEPEMQGMLAGYRWVLKRKGAKLPILLLPKE